MELNLSRLVLIATLISFTYSKRCDESYKTTTKKCSGWFLWVGCKKVTVYKLHIKCCEGWGGSDCSIPLCYKGQIRNACDIKKAGSVKDKHGVVVTNSGGKCTAPSVCEDCNKGFYPVTEYGGYCKACPKTEHCNQPVCTNKDDATCEFCEGEYAEEKRGHNVFTGLPDRKECRRACSWIEGARCFPGSCSNTTYMINDTDCKCAPGFGGTDCATAISANNVTILDFSMSLEDSNNHNMVADKALEKKSFWTKTLDWSSLSLTASSSYKPVLDKLSTPNYILEYQIGIENMQIDVQLSRETGVSKWTLYGACSNFSESCRQTISTQISRISKWKKLYKGKFKHGDRITYSVSAKNGGKIVYEDRSNKSHPRTRYYMLNGITTHETLEIGFDERTPIHCFEHNDCTTDALTATDFLMQPKLTVYWSGWSDLDSGIDEYEFNVYYLEMKNDSLLRYGKMICSRKASSTHNSITMDLKDPGPYSVEIITYDRARNFQLARRIIMFDDASVVELIGHKTKVIQAHDNGWVNRYSSIIEITWPGRFLNKRHSIGGWLNNVQENENRNLDDRKGRSIRTIDKIDNIQGITRFEIAYTVELRNSSKRVDFKRIPNEYFHHEKMIYDTEELIDGKKITYFIRGVDVFEKYAEDKVTVMIDLSPPVIQNLWLTKGDLVNISVHSVLELKDLTIEWEAFDYHSGIHEVSWKIFDNFTKNVLEHGQSHEPPQGETKTLNGCKKKYGSYPRGANCYCSPYTGCFHKHYQIKPLVSTESNGGLHFGKENGVHDYDYYIEVSVTNIAGLKTIKHKKVTIDTSPPHEGIVHDGIPGTPEVDFQQSPHLEGHWDGFFDKESSVWFYVYGFSKLCLTEGDLNIHMNRHLKVKWTYDSRVEFTAPSSGKYHLTIMAYNHALGHSKPVCSDGVTVDNEPAVVSEVVVQNSVTASGLVKSDINNKVYILHRNRELEEVKAPTAMCRTRATQVAMSILNLYPHKRRSNGTISVVVLHDNCNKLNGVHSDLISYITSDSKVDISWNVTFGAANVHDYEVGISSGNSIFPDVMDFVSSHHHQHIRLFHPDIFDGEQFYVMIKAITKSSVSDIKVVGPFVYDSSKPDFTGEINLSVEHIKSDDFLIARWDKDAFTDHGDPNALRYEAAIGTSRNGKDIYPFHRISSGGSCNLLTPPTCTAFSTRLLPWHLHGEVRYFVTIKVRDTAGHFVTASSEEYRHYIELASRGIVHDLDDSVTQFVDIDDVDYQTSTSKFITRWSGFEHPHENINFTVCISNASSNNYMACETSDDTNKHTFAGLHLKAYETYFHTVIAETEAGNVTAISDGVTIVIEGDEIKGIQVFDGLLSNDSVSGDLNLNTSHHDEDKGLICKNDKNFQSSTNALQAHWTLPNEKKHYLNDIFWAVEERAPVTDIWKIKTEYQHLRTTASYMEESDLSLSPGGTYRISLKFCARQYCFKPVHSDGITVVPNPPTTGNMTVKYMENSTMVEVSIEAFRDSDIEDLLQSRDVIDHYEWAFADESVFGRLLTKWQRIKSSSSMNGALLNVSIDLNEEITFTKCWIFAVRGYTKAGLSSIVSSEIRNCQDLEQVRPSVVIDAVGEPLSSEDDHVGKDIFLDKNDIWEQSDKDYTPYSNILSAVWPTLRYSHYVWAVLLVKEDDPTVFYDRSKKLDLIDPCEHPDTIRCGKTAHEFINILFNPGELTHGNRYIICIHANESVIKHEFWEQKLDEMDDCSNGVTIDLTPPVTADVWIGNKDNPFQTSTSELTVHWNSFIDVEEEGYAAHVSGVTHYKVALGTTAGGIDINPFTDVGLTNHKTFHNLILQNGHTYFATVTAYDFTGQFSSSTSHGVKVDTTPPQLTNASITLPSRYIADTEFVEACWKGVFSDHESGISHYFWAVGTHAGYDDVFPFDETEEECAKTSKSEPLLLKEGHPYFVTVKAHNKAGLYKAASSWAFVVESSPPVPGKVYDGPSGLDGSWVDVDFIENHSTLQAHWKGFHDPHSTMVEYFVNIGSCKNCEDVLVKQSVGIKTDIEFTFLQLSEGLHYYVTVTACNTANLCSSATSDGFVVDSTPPAQGIVTDGPLETDMQFQASRNYLGCEWDSFTDPQSDISHYVWRVGTTKGGDNILPATEVHKHEEAFIFDLMYEYGKHLPKGVRIYCTVRAYNRAGQSVEASSNGFIVDDTPPIFSTKLSMAPIGTIKDGTTVLRTTLRIHWDVIDDESFIESQHLSISSHMGGDFNLSSTTIAGIIRDYTFTDLDFHDGSYYCIKLISCNGANLCTTSILSNILVDSTRPSPGTFAINTDHAAELDRQPVDWMTWTTIYINLAWLGFEDIHSDIHIYTVNIGSKFMGNDLNEVPYTPLIVSHDGNASFHEDGKVQIFRLRTQRLNENKTVFISVTATNHVGLRSPVVHSQFNLLFGGVMELVRRCDSYSCLGHCVCAPHGKMCQRNNNPCHDLSGSDNTHTVVEVDDYLDLRFPDNYKHPLHSPINTMLGAKWSFKSISGARPIWYEWSVGESDHDSPLGVFDPVRDKVWQESGQDNHCVFTVDRGKAVLEEHKSYSVFVRIWYSKDTYAIVKSPGVTIFHSPPLSIVIKGKTVKEMVIGTSKDVDFITRKMQIIADWTGKFGGEISRYHLYLSTHPGGHDLHTLSKNIHPPVTSFNITGLNYEANTKYFTVVQAFNLAGLHTTEVSDGFMLDLEPPTPGIIMDGLVLFDKHATTNTSRVQSFWHGFSDIGSGIKTYEYCVSSDDVKGPCDIIPLTSIGIATRIQIYPKNQLEQGDMVRGGVRARDVIGHVSSLVSSNGVIIDTTAPLRAKSIKCQPNLLLDSSFENIGNSKDNYTNCDNMPDSSWNLSNGSCVSLEDSNMAQHGRTKLHLQGAVCQEVKTETHGKYRLTFHTSTIPSSILHLSTIEGFTQVNGQRYVFIMYSKPNTNTYAWQKHVFFFHLNTNTTIVEFGTVKSGAAFALDGIEFQLCEISINETEEAEGHVSAQTVFVHDWSSIHADWDFTDPETDILEYIWAIGTVQGGTQLQPFVSVGRRTFASNNTLRLEHDTVVFITVVAVNVVGLRTVSYSDPILIDLTHPICNFVNDGPALGQDFDFIRGLKYDFHWDISDPESGLTDCHWAIGSFEGDSSIQDFVSILPSQTNASKLFKSIPEGRIYATIRCTNGAGLAHRCSSDGVKLIESPPSVDDVILELMTTSATQYEPRGHYHGNNTEIRFRWTGFKAEDGVQSYLIALEGDKTSYSEIIESLSPAYSYASFTGLSLKDGQYSISVTGINEVKMYSQKRSDSFVLVTKPPSLTGSPVKTSWVKKTSTATASWDNVFTSSEPMYFEVSARLAEGGEGDLVQWQETVDTQIEIVLDTSEMPDAGVTVIFSVRAISYSGLFNIANNDLFVLP